MSFIILVIDDDKTIRNRIKEIFELELAGYEILTANNGQIGLNLALQQKVDMIILDWIMPVMGGAETLVQLKKHVQTSMIPVVALTSLKYFDAAFELGATDFIRKPLDNTELIVRVKSTLSMYKLIKNITEQAFKLEIKSKESAEQTKKLEIQQAQNQKLLENILPYEIGEQLKIKGRVDAKNYRMVSILFTDFVGFTKIAESLKPKEIVKELDFFFAKFDEIIQRHYIEKIKTIGDAYMCVGGIPMRNKSNPLDIILTALEMHHFIEAQKKIREKSGLAIWDIRIGVHTGSVVAGVIGTKKFAYDIWGDAVNTASRMESSGEKGKINISGKTYQYIAEYFDCTYRGKISAKNKGNIDMYFVERLKPEYSSDLEGIFPNNKFLSRHSEL